MNAMKKLNQGWMERVKLFIKREARWLMPGIGVKRWMLLILLGITMLALGLAFILLNIYRTVPDNWLLPIIQTVSLQSLARVTRAVIFGVIGLALTGWGMWGLNRSLLRPFIQPGKPIIDAVSEFRKKDKGPRIVVIGGGHGLATLLRGLKAYSKNLTAIVTVADDGGSSGELRRSMGVLPPGDIRNCLTALSNDEELLTQLFQYRFSDETGLNGHSLGNLFISGLAEITGSFEEAIAESGRVLAVQGQVLPSTLSDVRLTASVEIAEKKRNMWIRGESKIPKSKGQVKRLWLDPDNPPAYPPAIQAILAADLILIGPGSLYTSILPNLLVPDITAAIRASRAMKFFVCNLASQSGETDHYSSGDHVSAIENHVGSHLFDLIICNNNCSVDLPGETEWVKVDQDLDRSYPVYQTDLLDREYPWRHDSIKLAQVILDIYFDRTGPLPERDITQPI
jgi:uncharacterized cofD-like protein